MGDGLALLPCSPEMLRDISGIPTALPEPTSPTPQCCPAYTRESMNKAQDGKPSSVQAQFTACHELIASQFGKHWSPRNEFAKTGVIRAVISAGLFVWVVIGYCRWVGGHCGGASLGQALSTHGRFQRASHPTKAARVQR